MAREMKDSGIEWIGEIPDQWHLTRLGGLYRIRNTKVSDEDFPPLSVTMQGIVPQLDTAAKTNDHGNRKLVKRGDFAINSRSDRRGSCGISAYDGSVSLINTVLEPLNRMNPEYYGWLFHTVQFGDEFYRWGHGIVDDLWTTGWEDMKKITVPVPSLIEQARIASFLDAKCSEIDALTADIQSQIDMLEKYKRSVITEAVTRGLDRNVEMKDSGIPWIGKIPSTWKIVKLKYLGSSRNGLTYKPSDITEEGYGKLVLRSSNVQKGKIVLNDNIYVNTQVPEALKVRPGDILICSRNGSRDLIGKNALIGNLDATFGAFMMIYRSIDPEYMYFVLNSDIFSYYLGTFFTSTINQLTGTNFNNMKVVFCSDTAERRKVVGFLKEKCQTIDSIITDKQHQLALLDSYKKSLIYEYVTGKKEVPNAWKA